jgi:hypothetical protein
MRMAAGQNNILLTPVIYHHDAGGNCKIKVKVSSRYHQSDDEPVQ